MGMKQLNPNDLAEELKGRFDFITFDDTQEIFMYNRETCLYEPAEVFLTGKIQEDVGRDCSTHFVNETIASLKRQTIFYREDLNKNLEEIPLQDGILNFQTMEFRTYSEEDIYLAKHPILWDVPEIAGRNPIETFLNQVTANQNEEVLLKEIVGYCFYRAMPFQNFFLLVGAGANGKSVFLNILKAMLGDRNVSNQSLQSLAENRFATSSLYLKNANIFGDLSAKALTDTGLLKMLTGGDSIDAEQKFKASFAFKNFAKIIASCNEVPETPDHTEAFYRRAVLINFPNSFEGKENRDLYNEIVTPENLKHFFLVCINAFKDALASNGLIRVQTTQEKRELYMSYSNSAFAFFSLRLEYDPEDEIRVDDLKKEYSEFCRLKKLAVKDERTFFKKLMEFFGHKVWKKRKVEDYGGGRFYVYVGCGWKVVQ